MSRAPRQQVALQVTREARGRVPGDGIELNFGYWPGRGSPIVALHGLTASYINFIGIAERLAGRRSLFALDLRGRGDSDKPDGPYGLAQHARDVAAAMQLLDTVLAQRITQLQETYPSREVYREFWRARPNFPAADWGPWTEAFLNYEVGGEAPALRPKASEAAVRFDVAESFKTAEITARLKSLRVPVMLLRAAAGFALDRPQLIPDAAVEQMRTFLPELEEETIPG